MQATTRTVSADIGVSRYTSTPLHVETTYYAIHHSRLLIDFRGFVAQLAGLHDFSPVTDGLIAATSYMALCELAGNADMYGLGIRLGYYLQWYGGIFASLLAPEEVPNARFALGLFISATFLALVIQTVQDDLYAVEIYIILLLTFGAYLFLVPQLLWRLVTGCQPLLDPSRFPLVDPGQTQSDLHTILILAVTGYQLWFWFVKIPDLDRVYCRRFGFAFAKVPLNNWAFQVINIVLYFILGVAVLVLFTLRLSSAVKSSEDKRRRTDQWEKQKERLGKRGLARRVDALQKLNLVNNLITATVVVVATELTIKWNHVNAVNSLSSAGQLIPFVIGLGVVVRVLYVWRKPDPGPHPHSKSPHGGPTEPFHLPVYALPQAGRPPLAPHSATATSRTHGRPEPTPLPEYVVITPMSRQVPSKPTSRSRHASRSKPHLQQSDRHRRVSTLDDNAAPASMPAPVPSFQVPMPQGYSEPLSGNHSHQPREVSTHQSSSSSPSSSSSSSSPPHPIAPLPEFRLPLMQMIDTRRRDRDR